MAFRRSALVGALLATFALASTVPASAQTTPATPPAPAPGKPGAKPPGKPDEKKKDEAKKDEAKPPEPAPAGATAPAAGEKAEEKKEKDPDKEDKQAIYLSADLGFTRPDVGGFSDTTGLDKTSANGLLAGLGAGYRRESFRFGARFRDLSTTEFSLWSIMAEIGYGLKMRPVSPTFFVHVGYVFDNGIERGAFATKLPTGNILTPNIDLDGVMFGGEVVASYWITKFLRLGPFLGFDFTVLSRPKPPLPQSLFQLPDEVRNNALFGDSGAGFGYVLSIGIRLTGDVGF